MKNFLLIIILIILLSGIISADYFKPGEKYITGQIDMNVNTRPFSKPFGFSFGYGLLKKVEVGATFMMHFWSGSQNYTFSGDLFYHFTNPKKPMILFAGFSAGYNYYNFQSNDWVDLPSMKTVFIFPVLSARYYFKKKIAVSLKYARSFNKRLGSNLLLGLIFTL